MLVNSFRLLAIIITVVSDSAKCFIFPHKTHLYNAKAKHRRRDVADPHARHHSHEHVGNQHRPRPRARLAQDKRRHHLGNVIFAQRGRDRKATEQEHDDGRPHGGKDVLGRVLGFHAHVRFVFGAHHTENDAEEWDEERGDEEGDNLDDCEWCFSPRR